MWWTKETPNTDPTEVGSLLRQQVYPTRRVFVLWAAVRQSVHTNRHQVRSEGFIALNQVIAWPPLPLFHPHAGTQMTNHAGHEILRGRYQGRVRAPSRSLQ